MLTLVAQHQRKVSCIGSQLFGFTLRHKFSRRRLLVVLGSGGSVLTTGIGGIECQNVDGVVQVRVSCTSFRVGSNIGSHSGMHHF